MIERRDFLTQISLLLAAILIPWKSEITKWNVCDISYIGTECGTISAGRLGLELVTIQPMTKPSGLMFYMDYKYAR